MTKIDLPQELSASLQYTMYFWYEIFTRASLVKNHFSFESSDFKKIPAEMVDFALRLEAAVSESDLEKFNIIIDDIRRKNEVWQNLISNESLRIFSYSQNGIDLRIVWTPEKDPNGFYVLSSVESDEPRHSQLENWLSVLYKTLHEYVTLKQTTESADGSKVPTFLPDGALHFLRSMEPEKLLEKLESRKAIDPRR
jgi:hypothetical protein